jgi:hypothetical protein
MDPNAPRFAAASFELKEGTGEITHMYPSDGFLEIYKIDATFRVQSPESLDPEVTNPNMLWVAQLVSDIGSGNKIVARVFIQSIELLKLVLLPSHIDKATVISILHECKNLLLTCASVASDIETEVYEISKRIEQQDLPRDNLGRGLNPFPQVQELTDQSSRFLVNAKRYAQLITEIFNSFFQTEFHGPHFHKIRDWAKDNLVSDSPVYQLVKDNEPIFKYFIELRNCQEHSKKDKKTIVENFRLLPDLSIRPPVWHVTGSPHALIVEEMRCIVDFLLEFTELFLIQCILEKISDGIPYCVVVIPKEQRNKNCPIKYRLQIDPSGFIQ